MKKTPHKVVYARIAPEIVQALQQLADEENRSVSNMVETIIKEYLEKKEMLPKLAALASLKTSSAAQTR